MRYIKKFENYSTKILIVVDVQKSFKKYFTDKYLNELNKYCDGFDEVYQIWDNHSEGTDVDKDYLYDSNPNVELNDDLYVFPNQIDLIEKRYRYDVDVDFYKKILDEKTFKDMKQKEDNGLLKRGDIFSTNQGNILVYIGNNHVWFDCPKKLYNLFSKLKGKDVIIVGGSKDECLLDVEACAIAIGVIIKKDSKFIYSASNCPI